MNQNDAVRPITVILLCNHSFTIYSTVARAQTLVHTYTYCNSCRGMRLVMSASVATKTE